MAFYLINKKANLTSHDVTSFVKKKLGVKKAGHSGTLDPFAQGLIIIATDSDTKYLEFFLNGRKTYIGTISFGTSTDTHDLEGKTIKTLKSFELDLLKIQSLINKKYLGKIKQLPPKFSAIKLKGKKAYELAREGIDFELKPVERIVYEFKIEKTNKKNILAFEVEVSSGTYIRSLIRDISQDIEIPAHLESLTRTKIDNISISNSQNIDEELKQTLRENLIPIKEVKVSSGTMKTLLEGKTINFIISNSLLIFTDGITEVLAFSESLNVFKIKKRIK